MTPSSSMRRACKQYSQYDEENHILAYFRKYWPLSNIPWATGTFLDIGANDGITLSNTRKLNELSWYGVFVEPSVKSFKELQSNMILGEAHNIAIGQRDEIVPFFESGPLLNGHDHSLVSSILPKFTNKYKTATKPGHKVVQYDETEVVARTFRSFRHLCQVKHYDFISIDAEGMDLAILEQIDLTDVQCQLICLEHNNSPVVRWAFAKHCSSHGLNNVIYENRTNIIYGRNVI